MDKKILTRISRQYTLNQERNDEFAAYDNMVALNYDLPESLANRADIVKFVDPGAHDAEKVAANIYDTYAPRWNVLPRGPQDKDEAEKMERWLEWQMKRADMHGETEPSRITLLHALRYTRIAMQLDYLPYWLPKDKKRWNKQQKAAMKRGPFCVVVHHPSTVYYEMGSYGLRWVSTVSVVPAADVIDHWKAYESGDGAGAKIKSAIKQIEQLLEDDEEATVVLVDYTDESKRYVACWYSESADITFEVLEDTKSMDVIEIVNTENELPFINWSISVGSSDSLLATLHKGHLWENTNLAETLKRTAAFRTAFQPKGIETGVGEEIEVDYTGDVEKIVVPPGKNYQPLAAQSLDPMWNELSAQDRSLAASTTSTSNLTNLSGGSNVQYATVQAIININLTQLVSYKRTWEKAWRELGYLAFQWIKFTGNTEKAYRTTTKNDRVVTGEQIDIGPNEFDEDSLYITVELNANNPTDKMQRVNEIAQLVQVGAPVPWTELLEGIGYGNPEALIERWEDEQVRRAALDNFKKELDAQLQMKLREAEMQMQMKLRQSTQKESPVPKTQGQVPPTGPTGQQPVFPQGQGANPAAGGSPPEMAAPGMTATQIPGER